MRTWDLWLCVLIYTVTFFWFGMWVQKRSDQRQLAQWYDETWTKGCRECAQFEKNVCARDQLQGVVEHPRIKQ